MRIKFDKNPLVKKSFKIYNYVTKVVNFSFVYELNAWPRNPTKNLKFKNCLFGETNIVESSDKEEYVYSEYGVLIFDNDSARNVTIFGIDNSSSSHS